jgi:hypothetical protein
MLRRLALLIRLGTIVLTRSTNKPLREIVTVLIMPLKGLRFWA